MSPVAFPDATDRGQEGPIDAPVTRAVAVTPSDSAEVSNGGVFPRALYIGVGGDVTVDMAETGTDILFKNTQSGQVLPIRVKKVKETGTGATDIVALY